MSIIDNFTKKITKTSRETVKKAKDFNEISKLNSQLTDIEKKNTILYQQIGLIYFEKFGESPSEDFAELCKLLHNNFEEIAKIKNSIEEVRNSQTCPNCGAEYNGDVAFCGSCGYLIKTTSSNSMMQTKCKKCGATISETAMFCSECGTPKESEEK